MAEEHRCDEGHRPCANNCGFFGSSATLNLCSKCYRDLCLKEEQASSAKFAVGKTLATAMGGSSFSTLPESDPVSPTPLPFTAEGCSEKAARAAEDVSDAAADVGRCIICRRRVGLAGFKCRCGKVFCGGHRHPESHGCLFDYRRAGREAICKANPVVVAEKLRKI